MKCPNCESTSYRKNGRLKGRQRYQCRDCGRQFLEPLATQPPSSFSGDQKQNVHSEQNGYSKIASQQNLLNSPQILSFREELIQLFSSSEFIESSGFQKIIQALQPQQHSQFSSDSPTSIIAYPSSLTI
ncbi:MAG: hypothetical protein SWJ54_18835 [Cyanobacteriota bacterium]|nr:hypothetical protein [Cyanobacteriota bacterium]